MCNCTATIFLCGHKILVRHSCSFSSRYICPPPNLQINLAYEFYQCQVCIEGSNVEIPAMRYVMDPGGERTVNERLETEKAREEGLQLENNQRKRAEGASSGNVDVNMTGTEPSTEQRTEMQRIADQVMEMQRRKLEAHGRMGEKGESSKNTDVNMKGTEPATEQTIAMRRMEGKATEMQRMVDQMRETQKKKLEKGEERRGEGESSEDSDIEDKGKEPDTEQSKAMKRMAKQMKEMQRMGDRLMEMQRVAGQTMEMQEMAVQAMDRQEIEMRRKENQRLQRERMEREKRERERMQIEKTKSQMQRKLMLRMQIQRIQRDFPLPHNRVKKEMCPDDQERVEEELKLNIERMAMRTEEMDNEDIKAGRLTLVPLTRLKKDHLEKLKRKESEEEGS